MSEGAGKESPQRLVPLGEIVGTHGVYNFNAGSSFGVDERARVLVQLQKGAWTLMP